MSERAKCIRHSSFHSFALASQSHFTIMTAAYYVQTLPCSLIRKAATLLRRTALPRPFRRWLCRIGLAEHVRLVRRFIFCSKAITFRPCTGLHPTKSGIFMRAVRLEIFVISPTGELTVIRLGNNPEEGEVFQAVVPAGCWFGSKPALGADFLI